MTRIYFLKAINARTYTDYRYWIDKAEGRK